MLCFIVENIKKENGNFISKFFIKLKNKDLFFDIDSASLSEKYKNNKLFVLTIKKLLKSKRVEKYYKKIKNNLLENNITHVYFDDNVNSGLKDYLASEGFILFDNLNKDKYYKEIIKILPEKIYPSKSYFNKKTAFVENELDMDNINLLGNFVDKFKEINLITNDDQTGDKVALYFMEKKGISIALSDKFDFLKECDLVYSQYFVPDILKFMKASSVFLCIEALSSDVKGCDNSNKVKILREAEPVIDPLSKKNIFSLLRKHNISLRRKEEIYEILFLIYNYKFDKINSIKYK